MADTKLRQSYNKYLEKYKSLKKEGHLMHEKLNFDDYKEAAEVLKLKASYKGKNISKTLSDASVIITKSQSIRIRKTLREELGEDVSKKDIIGLNIDDIVDKYGMDEGYKSKSQALYLSILNSSGKEAANEAFGY